MTPSARPHQQPLALGHSKDALAALLVQTLCSTHKGRSNGIRAEDLAAQLGVTARALRELVSAAREDGIAIVGVPETGYYVAQSADELEECCAFLRARAMHSLRIESRLRKVALGELLGQLRVAT